MLGDNQGTIRDVVDSSGSLVNHVVYDSFGKVQSQSNAGYDLRFGYTGREQDGETGLDYYRARYYDAGNGRFISEDPIGFEGGDSNLTRYVRNNPVNWVDPSGLEPVRRYAGTIDGFVNFLNRQPIENLNNLGQLRGDEAARALRLFGRTDFTFRPINTGRITNLAPDRYIYTKDGGWIDMNHFMFYAARSAIKKRMQFLSDPVPGCILEGYIQEARDPIASKFSYEDLPSDRFGAEFASSYFDSNSRKTLGEQIRSYLIDRLGATSFEEAPNWNNIPYDNQEGRPPIATNSTVVPMFTKTNRYLP